MNTVEPIHEAIVKAKSFFYDKLGWRSFLWVNIVFWGGGILVGFASVLMTYASNEAEYFFRHVLLAHWYLPLITTPFSFVFIILAVRVVFSPAASGSGIPQIIASLHTNGKFTTLLSLRAAAGKYLLLIALMFGACVGREGPIAQVGACMMLSLAPLLPSSRYDFKPGLVMAGSAAGIAAAFDAPLGGIIFAIECLARRFETRVGIMLLGAVALSGVVGYFILGDYYAYFGVAKSAVLNNMSGWFALIVVGVLGGLLGGVFTFCFVQISKRMIYLKLLPILAVGFIAGLIVVGLGILSHGLTYGSGYREAIMIVQGQQLPASFPFYKAIAALFSVASGLPGGIFSPALTVGASLGQIFSHWFPAASPTAIAIIGMVAFFCGVTRLPITSFTIVMQIEHVQSLAVPLVVAALIANISSSFITRRPFYDALADIILARQQHEATQEKDIP